MGVAFAQSIAPNSADMLAHATALFGRAPSGLVELAWIDRRNNGMAHSGARLFDLGGLDDLVIQALAWNREKKNIYIGATLKNPDTAPFCRTSDSDAHAAWAVWADFDDAGAVEKARALITLPPSLVVVTGVVPYVREHWWWLLDEPVTDMAALRAQIGAIAGTLGGDPTVVNPSRIMRLAGTVAWPVKPGRTIERVTLRGGDNVQYPAAAIEQAFPGGDLLARQAGASPKHRSHAAPVPPAPAPPAAPRALGSLGILPAPLDDGRESYMRDTILAVMRQLIGTTGAAPTPEELFDAAWPQYAAHVDLSRAGRGKDEFAQKCATAVRRFGAGRIKGMHTLEEAVASHQAKTKNGRIMPLNGDARAMPPVGGDNHPEFSPAAHADLAQPFILRPASQIPRRRWLYGTSYIRSFVSVLASTGGAGKTTLYIAEALAIATGKPILGVAPSQRTGVWVLNLEDPADEMERRIAAAAQHHGIGQDDIAGRLFVDAGRNQPVTVAAQTRNGIEINVPIVDRIAAEIREKSIGVMIVDPFVASHAVPENDNGAINAVLALWRHIADATNSCILLVHHVRKPNGEEMTADSIRGGSALIGAVRTARVLNPMSEVEAAKLGIEPEQRRRYVRIDDAKNNLAPPASRASWLQIVSVELANGGIAEGDKVGVCTTWSPPDAWDGVTGDHLLRAHKYLSDFGPQPADSRSERWFGHAVIEMLGIPPGAASEAKVKAVLKGWIQSGAIKRGHARNDRAGRDIPAFIAGDLKGAGSIT